MKQLFIEACGSKTTVLLYPEKHELENISILD